MGFEADNDPGETPGFEFEEVEAREEPASPHRWWRWGTTLRSRYSLRINTERHLERHLIDRLPNLPKVGWFLSIWLLLIFLLLITLLLQIRSLTAHYTVLLPDRGGTYTEGLVGRATNFNPIYASTEVDRSVAKLVFANLFDYDQDNRLRPVLAESLEANEKAQQYTVRLKAGLRWHDGEELDADDVVFTIRTIKNPDAQSPLRVNWEGVSVDKVDDLTVKFTLPAAFSPFGANLVLPVLPEHLLASENVKQLRDADFNYRPVGSGPFVFERLVSLGGGGIDDKEFRIRLARNTDWPHPGLDGAAPLLDSFHFWVVPTAERLTELFNQGQISGAFNLSEEDISLDSADWRAVDLNLMNGVYLFFKNSSPRLQDASLRRALISALDIAVLLDSLDRKTQRIFGPLLPEHDGYDAGARPPGFDPGLTRSLLEAAGWQRARGGWSKDDQTLLLTLTTQKDTPYETLAREIKRQLAEAGIKVELDLRPAESVPLEILQNHNYGDMLIYGINLGGDADVYSYWHSSQVDSNSTLRLNLSEYQSGLADEALEVARSRNDAAERRERYGDFQRVWMDDLPALALYRFRLTYYTLRHVSGPRDNTLVIDNSDRFTDVSDWAVNQRRRTVERPGGSVD